MFFEIIISLFAISFLIILHELGHYLVAKKFNVKVEEFGLGFPPRLYGKKIGETIWSLNWIPFGGFVRMYDEHADIENKKKLEKKDRSFSKKPIWQRMLIVIAGCLVFWLLAFLMFIFTFSQGTIVAIDDDQYAPDAVIRITQVEEKSPAYIAEIRPGDIIQSIIVNNKEIQINKIKDLQNIIRDNPGQEIILYIKRGEEIKSKNTKLQKENPVIGVDLQRVAFQSFPIYEAIPMAAKRTIKITLLIGESLPKIPGEVVNLIKGEEAGITGPVGIVDFMGERIELGIVHFINFLALISINLAIINLLPIPGLDGGKLVFLAYEWIRAKPFPQKIEIYITAFFLILLLGLILIVTVADIRALF